MPFIVSQQRLNKKFIMMNNEIIQLRSELLERSRNYLLNKENVTNNTKSEGVENAIDYVFNDVISKVSKRNIEALGKVNFSAKIDFSVDGGLKIAEIEHIESTLFLVEQELEWIVSAREQLERRRPQVLEDRAQARVRAGVGEGSSWTGPPDATRPPLSEPR